MNRIQQNRTGQLHRILHLRSERTLGSDNMKTAILNSGVADVRGYFEKVRKHTENSQIQ